MKEVFLFLNLNGILKLYVIEVKSFNRSLILFIILNELV